MKTIEKMNIKFGNDNRAEYVIDDVRIDTEINVDYECQSVIDDFCSAVNDDIGYTVSVWFDE